MDRELAKRHCMSSSLPARSCSDGPRDEQNLSATELVRTRQPRHDVKRQALILSSQCRRLDRMFVLTVDQRNSRRGTDRIEALLAWVTARDEAFVRQFERTAGDEVQGILSRPGDVVSLVLALVRQDAWSVGVGVGAVNEPLPASTRAGSGPAFNLARDAVTAAKSRRAAWRCRRPPMPLRTAGADRPGPGGRAACTRRTDRGGEAAALARPGAQAARDRPAVGVTKQAVSQRLRAAEWHLEARRPRAASQLLSVADGRVGGCDHRSSPCCSWCCRSGAAARRPLRRVVVDPVLPVAVFSAALSRWPLRHGAAVDDGGRLAPRRRRCSASLVATTAGSHVVRAVFRLMRGEFLPAGTDRCAPVSAQDSAGDASALEGGARLGAPRWCVDRLPRARRRRRDGAGRVAGGGGAGAGA